jgi:hypothetical protein
MINFFLKSMLKSKLKGVPEAEIDRLIQAMNDNPELFKQIAKEVEEKTKAGTDQQQAVMEVLGKHQDVLKTVFK